MKQKLNLLTMLWVTVILFYVGNASAYSIGPEMSPTELTIKLTTNVNVAYTHFTRYLRFENVAGDLKDIAIPFVKQSTHYYTGVIKMSDSNKTAINALRALVKKNNRSYWDKMYFVNKGGAAEIDIKEMKIIINYPRYTQYTQSRLTAQIGLIKQTTSKIILETGSDSIRISNSLGRREDAKTYLNWSNSFLNSVPVFVRGIIYDLGKSGSSDSSDSSSLFDSNNPKYTTKNDTALCSETISWYYYHYKQTVKDLVTKQIYNFRDIESHNQMHDAFKNSGRLYCYHYGLQDWVKRNRDYSWNYSAPRKHPEAGDYLDRRDRDITDSDDDGHAMMVLNWEEGNDIATVIEGPWNVNFRKVDVKGLEAIGRDYCFGRIPAND